ncbi:MAG: hypothetical protein ABIR52_02020, partial [Casimicrobiaceae bacterium]
PDLAASTASIASARIALASSRSDARPAIAEAEEVVVALSDMVKVAIRKRKTARGREDAQRREGVENYRESTTFVQ